MPQVDVKWPTEDEEFDTANIQGFSPAFALAGATVSPDVNVLAEGDNNVSYDEVGEGGSSEPSGSEEQPSETPSEPAPAASAPEPSKNGSANGGMGKVVTSAKGGFAGRSVLEIVLALLVIVLAVLAFSFNSDNSKLKQDNSALKDQVAQLNANPQAIIQRQTQALVNQVGKLMQLPANETPTVAQVTDVNAAKQQSAFFNNAQNGDKVLMYVKAGEAILYRPSTNKIVLVAPLTFNNATPTKK